MVPRQPAANHVDTSQSHPVTSFVRHRKPRTKPQQRRPSLLAKVSTVCCLMCHVVSYQLHRWLSLALSWLIYCCSKPRNFVIWQFT